MITKAELDEWKTHPVTKEVFDKLEASMQDTKDAAIELGAFDDVGHKLARLNAHYEALKQVIEMEADEDGE